ncbi:MAG: anti-sigma factor antagonist, partial [Thermoleophilia bacterium]|nr:anti-sigma factor antagonist [Thermoleophilia bacterium]
MRGEVCVIHCGGVDGESLAGDLPGELHRCLGTGATAVVVDLDPWAPMDDQALEALRNASRTFREAGGELVMAVEEPEARAALA